MPYDDYAKYRGPYDDSSHINGMDYNDSRPYSRTHTPPYPPYGPDRLSIPQPQQPQPQQSPQPQMMPAMSMPPPTSSPSNQYPEPYHGGYGGSWHHQQQYPQPQPQAQPQTQPQGQAHAHTGRINDAVNSAFSDAERPSYLSPEVVSQITANVIQQLKMTGLDGVQGGQQQQPGPSPRPSPGPPPGPSPGPNYTSSPGPNYTPSPTSRAGHEDAYPAPAPPPPEYQYSPRPASREPVPPPMERQESRDSRSSDPSSKVESRSVSPSRDSDPDLTTLEKIWGRLFEGDKPTRRLGQLLRGIAFHLIEDYAPENSLVVTLNKMQKFYEDTAVPSDPYPWQDIFDDPTSSVSRLLRKVEAEHHLVQATLNERPDIPGLTPRGFERWATLMIQIHPEKEFQRLQKAVLNMPVNNPDNKRERFPKEIPRRLFPETPNLALREEIDQYIRDYCAVDLPPITEEEIAAERRHKSYRSPTVADESEEEHRADEEEQKKEEEEEEEEEEEKEPMHNPIERERKPYTASPGGLKENDGFDLPKPGDSRPADIRPTHSRPISSRPRDDSTSSQSRPGYQHSHDPYYPRTGSQGPRSIPTRTGRSRSSSRGIHGSSYDGRHSDGDLLTSPHHHHSHHLHSSSGAPRQHSGEQIPESVIEESRRYRDLERKEDKRLFDALRERDHREREKSSHYHAGHYPRGTGTGTGTGSGAWTGEDEYHRGAYGGPVGGSGSTSGGYDWYGYR